MTTTQETPTEHSTLIGGSTAARRLNCPVSFHYEKIAPKSRGSSYAREGTALHEMIAVVLDQGKDPQDLLPFTHKQPPKGVEEAWELTIDHDLWDELGQPALDMFDQFLEELEAEQDEPAVYYIEKRFEFPGVPGGFGTSDVVFRCGKVGGIWDWKFGRGEVKAEDNDQLLFYFASALAGLPQFFAGIEQVRLCISQPKTQPSKPKVWDTTLEDVENFKLDVQDALQEIKDGSIKTMEPAAGDWCKFADCKTVCPLHYGAAAKLGSKLEALEKMKHGQAREEGLDLSEFLADAMGLAELAESWAKHVAGITQERLENGLEVPGWKLVPKRSSGKTWTLEDDVIKRRLSSRGLKAPDYLITKVISPTQAEAKLKKLGKDLPDDLYEQKPSSGHTLTRAGDPRHEAETPAKKAKALGSALAARMEAQE